MARLRADSEMTFRELADATADAAGEGGKGLSRMQLCRLEAGENQPCPAAMELIAAALGTSPRVFAEYRLAQARALLDERGPGGLEAAMRAFEASGLDDDRREDRVVAPFAKRPRRLAA